MASVDDAKRKPVDQELFDRTAPRWNCVDYPGGMHYMRGGRCRWCGGADGQEETMAGSFARRVAEQILNEAQSGSAVWDELNGPSARLEEGGDGFIVTIPLGYEDVDEQDEPTGRVCTIVVRA